MKKLMITSYKTLSLILAILSTASVSFAAPSLLMGTIQFSKNSTLLPLSVNCGGTQIMTTLHETVTPKITFEIPKATDQSHFDVLITSAKIDFQLKELPNNMMIQNTFDYLKIDAQASYLYYVLDFIDDAWEIKEEKLPETGQIPDRTIIIECYPEWVTAFKGGSAVELPTLFINNTLITAQSDNTFEDDMIKLELTALDSNIIHSPMRRQIHTASDKKRILIMDLIV